MYYDGYDDDDEEETEKEKNYSSYDPDIDHLNWKY